MAHHRTAYQLSEKPCSCQLPRRQLLGSLTNTPYTTSSVYVIQATMLAREEIELAFVAAGWEIAGRSSPHLVAANAGGVPVSIRAYGPSITGSDEPLFELIDRLLELTYWVREVPTPRAASALIREHGGAPGEKRGKPYERT